MVACSTRALLTLDDLAEDTRGGHDEEWCVWEMAVVFCATAGVLVQLPNNSAHRPAASLQRGVQG